MENSVFIKSYKLPSFDKKEILRYMGAKNSDEKTDKVINEAINLIEGKLKPSVCYIILPYLGNGDFSCLKVKSESLVKNLKDCKRVILFGATIGNELDRLILKYGKLSPLTALALQAIGAERIEALCDMFIKDMKKDYSLKPRFSPGYGDFSLEYQKDIFEILKPQGKIGLTLNSSLIMSPSKSVTAIAGICDTPCEEKPSCSECEKKDCEFRRLV